MRVRDCTADTVQEFATIILMLMEFLEPQAQEHFNEIAKHGQVSQLDLSSKIYEQQTELEQSVPGLNNLNFWAKSSLKCS